MNKLNIENNNIKVRVENMLAQLREMNCGQNWNDMKYERKYEEEKWNCLATFIQRIDISFLSDSVTPREFSLHLILLLLLCNMANDVVIL